MAEVPGDEAEGAGPDLVTATLAYLAKALVDHPEDVEVTASQGNGATIYRLRVNPEDMGRVIGRRGRTARAIRTVARAAAAKADVHAVIEIVG